MGPRWLGPYPALRFNSVPRGRGISAGKHGFTWSVQIVSIQSLVAEGFQLVPDVHENIEVKVSIQSLVAEGFQRLWRVTNRKIRDVSIQSLVAEGFQPPNL